MNVKESIRGAGLVLVLLIGLRIVAAFIWPTIQ
jgi:hypothetical protein